MQPCQMGCCGFIKKIQKASLDTHAYLGNILWYLGKQIDMGSMVNMTHLGLLLWLFMIGSKVVGYVGSEFEVKGPQRGFC